MELYIDKDFLEDFYLDYDDDPIKLIVKDIITNYGDKKVFINYNENEFEQLKQENEFFALICNTTVPLPINNIEEEVKKLNLAQTLVFTKKEEEWFEQIENKGAWCFSFDSYQVKIQEYITKLHFKVDLSTPFNNWDTIDFSTIPFNSLQLTDGYLLKDEKNSKENLVPLINTFVKSKKEKITIDLLLKELGVKNTLEEKKREFAKKQHTMLNSIFSNLQIRFSIYVSNLISNIDLHDRTVLTNFTILESGIGFSLTGRKVSNSQMVSESIFEKYTYDRLRRLKKIQQKYIDKLNSDAFQSTKFYKFP